MTYQRVDKEEGKKESKQKMDKIDLINSIGLSGGDVSPQNERVRISPCHTIR